MEIECSCEGCIFAFYAEDKQVSCFLGRSDLLNPTGRLQEKVEGKPQSFVYNRFCNTWRPQQYLDKVHKGDLDTAANNVINEVIPQMTYIINFNYNLQSLEQVLDDVTVNQSINNVGAIIVINDKVEYNEEIMEILNAKVLKPYGVKPQLLQMIGKANRSEKFDEAFNHAKPGWTVFLPQSQSIPTDFVARIHDRINYKMERFACSNDTTTGRLVVQSNLYKLLEGNKQELFIKKLKRMKTDGSSIIEWRDMFNE